MSGYSFFLEHIRKTILDGYIEDHKETQPHEVEKQAINCRYVFETLYEIFDTLSQTGPPVSNLPKRGEFLVCSDHRFKEIQGSLRACKYIVGHLFQHRYENFDLAVKNDCENTIRKIEKESRGYASESSKIKRTLAGWLEGERPSRLMVKDQAMDLLRYLLKLLDTHIAALMMEADLIATYCGYIRYVIEYYYEKKKTVAPGATVKAIVNIRHLIKATEEQKFLGALNLDTLLNTLTLCEEQIAERKERVQDIALILTVLGPALNFEPMNAAQVGATLKKEESGKSFFSKLFS